MMVKIIAWTGGILYWISFSVIVPVSIFVIVMNLVGIGGDRIDARPMVARSQIETSPMKQYRRWPAHRIERMHQPRFQESERPRRISRRRT